MRCQWLKCACHHGSCSHVFSYRLSLHTEWLDQILRFFAPVMLTVNITLIYELEPLQMYQKVKNEFSRSKSRLSYYKPTTVRRLHTERQIRPKLLPKPLCGWYACVLVYVFVCIFLGFSRLLFGLCRYLVVVDICWLLSANCRYGKTVKVDFSALVGRYLTVFWPLWAN